MRLVVLEQDEQQEHDEDYDEKTTTDVHSEYLLVFDSLHRPLRSRQSSPVQSQLTIYPEEQQP